MSVSVENTSTLGRRLTVSVPSETVTEQINNKMAKLAKEAHLKGFRRGKVPQSVLQKKFGDSIRMEVINELIRNSLGEAVQANDLKPAGTPKIEEINNEKGKNLEFVASFEIYPEIILADFSEVEIEKRLVDITEDDVANMISKLQDQLANWTPVNRAVQQGDKLTVDFSRLLNEENATRQEQKDIEMIIGSKGVLPGLDDALIGKHKEDEIEAELEYPVDWADAAVAGKKVTLWIKIHDIAEKHVLTHEELGKKLNQEGGIEDLTLKIRERMQDELDKTLRDELKENVLEKLLEKNPIELPQALIEQEKEAIYKELVRNKRAKLPREIINTPDVENAARKRVELGLLLNEVINKNDLKPDPQRVRAEVEKLAANFAKSSEIIDAYYSNKDLLHSIERLVLLEAAVDAILKDAKVIEKNATFDEVMNQTEELAEKGNN
ncbi:MAG: trigger factor [Proteobacteria bacterium]|nr:trigger factor [Pseudomonadota bacterium]